MPGQVHISPSWSTDFPGALYCSLVITWLLEQQQQKIKQGERKGRILNPEY